MVRTKGYGIQGGHLLSAGFLAEVGRMVSAVSQDRLFRSKMLISFSLPFRVFPGRYELTHPCKA